MENRRKTLTKKDNFTINIAQESCECACITGDQNSYITPCIRDLCNSELSQIQPSNPSTSSATNQSTNYPTNQPTLEMNITCSIYLQNEEVMLS